MSKIKLIPRVTNVIWQSHPYERSLSGTWDDMFPPNTLPKTDVRNINWANAVGIPANSQLSFKFVNDTSVRGHIFIRDGVGRYTTDGDATHAYVPPDHKYFDYLHDWVLKADQLYTLISSGLEYIYMYSPSNFNGQGLRKLRKAWPFGGFLVESYGWPKDLDENEDAPQLDSTSMEEFEHHYTTGLLHKEVDYRNSCIVHWSNYSSAFYY